MDLALQLEKEILDRVQLVDKAVETYLSEIALPQTDAILELRKSMLYSATNGGKRFRPILALLVGELLGANTERVLPFAIAVELIHTYSLIHDDLPCMDNDDFRRGKPTNHKVFGDDFALLAGDALLTEAFFLLADKYGDTHLLASALTKLLAEAAGLRGMVGGQAIDLRAGKRRFTLEELTQLHLLKTGALIRVAAEGAALIASARPSQIEGLRRFGEGLGLAFQVADDILDHGDKDQGARSFTGILGMDPTKDFLGKVSSDIRNELKKISGQTALLDYLIDFNLNREH